MANKPFEPTAEFPVVYNPIVFRNHFIPTLDKICSVELIGDWSKPDTHPEILISAMRRVERRIPTHLVGFSELKSRVTFHIALFKYSNGMWYSAEYITKRMTLGDKEMLEEAACKHLDLG